MLLNIGIKFHYQCVVDEKYMKTNNLDTTVLH